MKNCYFDLIEQTYYFPHEGFDLRQGNLTFHGVSLKHLIEKHGTSFRFIYLPKIGDQIKKALRHKVNLETSTEFDIDLILNLFKKGKLDVDTPRFINESDAIIAAPLASMN